MSHVIPGMSPQLEARAAGAFWAMVFAAGVVALVQPGGVVAATANTVAGLCYLLVTLLLYDLLRPVSGVVSLLAALFGLVGCTISLFHLAPLVQVRDLVFFGLQCVLVGYLVFRSTFLPRALGVMMVLAGLGWLTFVSPPLARSLSPYNLVPGMIGEGLLLVWLLVKGVDGRRWEALARGSRVRGV